MFIYWAAFIYSGHIYLCLFCLLMFAQTNTPWLSVTTPVCLHHTPNHTLQASLLSLNPHACAWLPKCTSAELRWHGWCAPGPVIVTSYSINCNVTVMMPDSVTVRSSIGESLDRHCSSNIPPNRLSHKTTSSSWPLICFQAPAAQVRIQGLQDSRRRPWCAICLIWHGMWLQRNGSWPSRTFSWGSFQFLPLQVQPEDYFTTGWPVGESSILFFFVFGKLTELLN